MNRLLFLTYHYIVDTENTFQKSILGPTRESFERQIDSLGRRFTILSPSDIQYIDFLDKNSDKTYICLTFDDGLLEHKDYVIPFLESRGLKGLFFPNTCIFEGVPAIPQVVHYSLAKYRVASVVKWMNDGIMEYNIKHPLIQLTNFSTKDLIVKIKNILKYQLNYDDAQKISLHIYKSGLFLDDKNAMKSIYFSKDDIRSMIDNGHTVGSHLHNHIYIDTHTNKNLIENEIKKSVSILNDIHGGDTIHFAYPYGKSQEINIDPILEKILRQE